MTACLVEVDDLVVSFDGFRAIDGVSLKVRPGELHFLIGPNGAGKTTLVDVITGLTRATSGSVHIDGVEFTGLKAHEIVQRGVGRSFQTPTVFDALTVTENVDLASTFRLQLHRLLRRRRGTTAPVAEALERVSLTDVADAPAGTLSHGQKQWLEIAMLLVQDQRLLLLDEPVAGMSPQERVATGELLQNLAGDHTVIVIEHDMAFLRRFATTVTVLHEGRIISEGSVAEVQSDPIVREVYLGRSRDERSGATAATEAPSEEVPS